MVTNSDFAQNGTKCAFMEAMENPQVSKQNSKRFRLYDLLNLKGHIPFLLSWTTVFIFKGFYDFVSI